MNSSSSSFAGHSGPRVVVGVDGSADGLRAVRYGARSAAATGAHLHLVHAVDDAVLAGAWGVVYDPSALQEAGREATEQAREHAREAGLDDSRIHEEVVLGNPVGVLGRLSEGAELLVTGRRSVSGLERMFIGSTSVSLAQAAACPVVVISAASTPEVTGDQQRIAVGVDAEPHSAATVEWALAEAERRDAALSVVHVVAGGQQARGAGNLVEAAGRGVHELLAPLVVRHPGVAVDVQVLSGSAVDELVGVTEEVDLLVLGVQRSRVLGIHLGGVMRGVLAHAGCPVAVVK